MCLFICCDENCCKIPKCKDIPIKRYFLPLIGVFALAALPEFRDFVYLPIVIIFGFLILFWNFPRMVYYTASKPLYYEDLFIDEKKLPNYDVDPKIKSKFQNILIWVLIITNSILVGVLADYWLYKTSDVQNYLEIIGVTGGIIKIFQVINNSIGRGMLKILKGCIKKENNRFRQHQKECIGNIVSLKHVESVEDIKTLELIETGENKIISK